MSVFRVMWGWRWDLLTDMLRAPQHCLAQPPETQTVSLRPRPALSASVLAATLSLTLSAGIGAAPPALAVGASPTPAATFAPAVPLYDAAGVSTNGSEPSIAVDSHDNVFVSAPAGVPTGGCPFWQVHPDGTYDYRGTIDTDQGSVGGGDCDISTTPIAGNATDDSVSITSLSLANLTSNVTTDGGKTFRTLANSASQQVFGVDRQWQTSDPSLDRHYLTVHDLAQSNIQMSVSTDGGYQYVQNLPAINPTTNRKALASGVVSVGAVSGSNHFGPTVVDPKTHKLYIPFLAPLEGSNTFGENTLYISIGDPCATVPCAAGGPVGPISWTTVQAYTAGSNVNLSNDFPVITMDRSGTLYAAFTGDVTKPATNGTTPDSSRIFVVHSATPDVSTSWTAAQAVDPGTGNANIFPWLVSGTQGNVGVAWYSSTLAASTTCPGAGTNANNPVSDNCRNLWKVSYAQSSNADSASPTWTVSDASGLIHRGPICNKGLSCAAGTRTLLDFFDVATDSQGRPNFAFVSDTRSLNTADVQYTLQCTGTSLTGVTLNGCQTVSTGPLPCAANAAYTDPPGDANNALGASTPTPSDPGYDLVGGNVTSTATDIVFTSHLNDLAASPEGLIVETHFKVAGKEYYAMAQRATPDGVETYDLGDQTGTQGGRKSLGTGTGSFDDTTDLVAFRFPRSVLGNIADGTLITDVIVTTRRDGVVLIPDVDVATSPCAFTVGAAAPDVIIPEVPYAALVPVLGLLALGGTVYLRRRRETARAA